MASLSDLDLPFSVTVHPFPSPTPHNCAYEHGSGPTGSTTAPENALIFIGGLTDGPHTVPYVRAIARQLAAAATDDTTRAPLGYSVFELRMKNSFLSFGVGRLTDDVADITALVQYLRGLGKKKIVLMGHSTGCQDCMLYAEFAKTGKSPAVDGFILQAPVSDREAFVPELKPGEYDKSMAIAESLIKAGREDELIPMKDFPGPIKVPHTAYRWHSFVGKNGDDDYFSSDLPDERLARSWSQFDKPVLLLASEKDEYVPATVDVSALHARWKVFVAAPAEVSSLSGAIPGANHRVEQAESQQWLVGRVLAFLAQLPGGV